MDTARLRMTGDAEAKLIALACSPAPKGYVRWPLNLLYNQMIVILEDRISILEEAEHIVKRLIVHYTPKHRGWLDIAEIGINAMIRESFNRRIPSMDVLKEELKVWNDEYDKNSAPFTCSLSRRLKDKACEPLL